MRFFEPHQKLVVKADFKPDFQRGQGREWVRQQVLELADKLARLRISLKLESSLRACGYGLIEEVRQRGLGVMADLKLFGLAKTLEIDGVLLRGETWPKLVTVAINSGREAVAALKAKLPDVEVLGVTLPTSLGEEDAQAMYGRSVQEAVNYMAGIALEAGLDGVVASAKEAEFLRSQVGSCLTINSPNIRPSWATVCEDGQNKSRQATPAEALLAGVDRIIVGDPILIGHPMKVYDAVRRTLDEITALA